MSLPKALSMHIHLTLQQYLLFAVLSVTSIAIFAQPISGSPYALMEDKECPYTREQLTAVQDVLTAQNEDIGALSMALKDCGKTRLFVSQYNALINAPNSLGFQSIDALVEGAAILQEEIRQQEEKEKTIAAAQKQRAEQKKAEEQKKRQKEQQRINALLKPFRDMDPVTCNRLISAINKNEVRARRDFPQAKIRVKGKVADIDVTTNGFEEYARVAIQESGDILNGCNAKMQSFDEAIDLNKGEEFDFVCENWDEVMGSVTFKDCRLLKNAYK